MTTKFRVWWIPQVPMEPFHFTVPSYAAGLMLCDALGQYDAFQLENNIKPDYSNAGGIEYSDPVLTEGEWWELDEDEAEEHGFSAKLRAELEGRGE